MPTSHEGTLLLRFEDVTQDGRLVLEALPHALSPLWTDFARNESFREARARGILPILTRFVLEGGPGPFPATRSLAVEATWRVARSDDGAIRLDMTATLSGTVGRTYEPKNRERDEGASTHGRRDVAGRVFAEHAFTRPFAPAGQRRVTALDFAGAPEVRESRPALPPPEHLARTPEGARPIDDQPTPATVPATFGILHTDSNMHVNSLAYLRLFEEAALRRFTDLGRGALWLGRRVEIAYRKPCFAGERLGIVLQAFEYERGIGVWGALVDDARAPLSRARTTVRMFFEP